MVTAEKVFHLPESARNALLRDAGHTPDDWHPDGHLRRETPALEPHQPAKTPDEGIILPEAAQMSKAMLAVTDIGRGRIQ